MNHIALLMENQPGALSRVIGLFSQRGYNIDSLSVAPTQDETLSRLTMTIGEEGADINQILKQLYKLVDVVMVQNLSEAHALTLELAIIKLKKAKTDVEGLLKNYEFESNFDAKKINNLFSDLSSLNILELNKLKRDYNSLGYSVTNIDIHMQKLISYPIYLTIMTVFASIVMLNVKRNKSKIF